MIVCFSPTRLPVLLLSVKIEQRITDFRDSQFGDSCDSSALPSTSMAAPLTGTIWNYSNTTGVLLLNNSPPCFNALEI